MRLLRGAPTAYLFFLVLLICLLAKPSAADLPSLSTASDDNSSAKGSSAATTASAAASSGASTAAKTTDSAAKTTGSAAASKTDSSSASASGSASKSGSSASASGTKSGSSSGSASASKSGSASSAAASSTAAASSSESASGTSSDKPGLTGLPTLSGAYKYPPPSVPPTANAPYMQKSNLPEGTVFICVGAVLGFLGLSVLAWRGLVVWSLHRSVKRAAMHQHAADSKAMLRPPGGGFYSAGAGSTLSLDALSSGKGTPGPKGHTPSSSLFFSPTATAGMHTSSNRHSSYLPAGYYAAGNSAAGNGAGMTHIGGNSIGLSSLGPQSHGYSRARSMGPSPPGSPSLPPSREGNTGYARGTNPSATSLGLSAPPQGRAPSAYLEDLFESHQADGPAGDGGRF